MENLNVSGTYTDNWFLLKVVFTPEFKLYTVKLTIFMQYLFYTSNSKHKKNK